MSSKGTILLTGANGGLGAAVVRKIATTPEFAAHHGLYTVRAASSAPQLRAALRHAPPSHAHDVLSLDLASVASVRAVAADINARVAAGEIPRIVALVLNAGFVEPTTQSFTEDGVDMTFASNYLGHWLLTLLLLGSMDSERGRIVVLTSPIHDVNDPQTKSQGHLGEEWMNVFPEDGNAEAVAKGTWSPSRPEPMWRAWHAGQRRYGAAKLAQVMMIGELQRRLNADPFMSNISVLGLDPGTMPTDIARRTPWLVGVFVFKAILPLVCALLTWLSPDGALRTTSKSATDVLAMAFEVGPPLCERPKGWYMSGMTRKEPSVESKDERKRKGVWKESVRLTGLKEGETALKEWK